MFLIFCYFSKTGKRIIWKGHRKLLELKDLLPLSAVLKSRNQYETLCKKYKDPILKRTDNLKQESKEKTLSLACLICKTWFWPWISVLCLLEILLASLNVILALIFGLIIQFTDYEEEYLWKGYLYCVVILIVTFSKSFLQNIITFLSALLSSQVKAAFSLAVYRKFFRLSNSAKRSYSSGEMLNLMSIDIDKIFQFLLSFTQLFSSPLKIIINFALLWKYLEHSCLAGFSMMLLMVLLLAIIAKVDSYYQKKQMYFKDIRSKLISEIIDGIQFLKLWAWDISFVKRVTATREKEIKCIRGIYFCLAGSTFAWGCSTFLVAIASFVTYLLVDDEHILHPSTVFVSVNLIASLRGYVYNLPFVISEAVQSNVSLKRLKLFLAAEEFNPDFVGTNPDEGDVLTMKNTTFSWAPTEDPVLKDLYFSVSKKSLVAIIGVVGCGKSSLFSAVLGMMEKVSGSVDVKGRLGYVPQQAWVQNKTLKENILFGKEMNEPLYEQVLDACCLKPDLENLPAGDRTLIGERGVNLSGGQKQRISLARAVFDGADVFLLDDPLSAVDPYVAKQLFDRVIGNNGLLKNKTRILVTHNLSILSAVDVIIHMKDGMIVERGTYKELLSSGALSANYFEVHANKSDTTKNNGDNSISKPMHVTRQINVSISMAGVKQMDEEEKRAVGKVKFSLYISYIKQYSVAMVVFYLFFAVAYQAFEIGSNVLLKEWSEDPTFPNGTQDLRRRNHRITVYACLGFCQATFTMIAAVLLAFGCARASRLSHQNMLTAVMRSTMRFFDVTPKGRIMNRFIKDTDVMDLQLPHSFDCFCAVVFFIIGVLCVLSVTIPKFLFIVVPFGVLFYKLQGIYLNTSRQLKRLEATTRSPILSHFSETIWGIACIKAFDVKKEFLRILEEKLDTHTNCYFLWMSSDRWLNFYLGLMSSAIITAVSFLAVINRNLLSGADVGLSLGYALLIANTLVYMVLNSAAIENHSVSVERVDEYSQISAESSNHNAGVNPLWPVSGSVTFSNYCTRYQPELDLVLKNVTLDIFAGEKIGVVGRTGSGKSSLVLALFRIIEPVEGKILVDGLDITKVDLHDLRSKMTIIPQVPVLFTGSLRSNLDPQMVHSDEEIWTSLEKVHMKKFVADFAEGFDYQISERGENLSIGQKQLLCLARALLRYNNILVLDEATAAVDVETDCLIQETLRSEFQHCTMITIAHRLNTIMDYNRVIVMKDGRLVEVGSPSELVLDNQTHFYSMATDAGLV